MDKIEIFKDLSVKDLRTEDIDKFSTILGDYYGQFTDFCNFVQDQCGDIPGLEDHIKGLECSIGNDGAIFSIGLDNGETKEIHFDNPKDVICKGEGKIVYQNKFPSHHLTIEEIEEKEVEKEKEQERLSLVSTRRTRKKK